MSQVYLCAVAPHGTSRDTLTGASVPSLRQRPSTAGPTAVMASSNRRPHDPVAPGGEGRSVATDLLA